MINMSPPITHQPGVPLPPGYWMPPSEPIVGCPPGLEYLTQLDQVIVHQGVELLEAFTGWETNNKYAIKNSMGQQIYYAFEDSGCCMRVCCGHNRGFVLHIVNNYNQEILRVSRDFKCCAGCCWCAGSCDGCAQEVMVESPPGNLIGSVKQTGDVCNYNYNIRDASGNTQLQIQGPFCMCSCGSDVDFPVYTMDGGQIGDITKQWSGCCQEMCTTADNFGITFPVDLEVKTKATLIGAMFLIDFMAFEQKPKKHNDSSDN